MLIKGTGKGTTTNRSGEFEFRKLKEGTYILQVSLTGYETIEQAVAVEGDKTSELVLQLKLSHKQLREFVVTTGANKFATKESEYVAKMSLENLENPQVYTVITSELMKEQMVVDYKTALRGASGTTTLAQAGNGRPYTFIRGFITGNFIRNGVGAYQYSGVDPVNIDHIEVIKGPSGTLFGTGMVSYGGLVNRVTKKPMETFRGEITYNTGSYGLNRLSADINTPLTEDKRALLRVNAAFHGQGSFQDMGYEKNYIIAPSFKYKVNDRLTVLADAELYQRNTSSIVNYNIIDGSQLGIKDFSELKLDYKRSYSSNDVDTRLTNYNVFLQANYRISSSWTSQTLFTYNGVDAPEQYFMNPTILDNTRMARSVAMLSDRYHTVQFQQNFNGDFHIGSMRNRLLIGFDAIEYAQDPNYYISTPYDTIDYTQPGGTYISKGNLKNALDTLGMFPGDQKIYNYGVYFNDVINLTDRLIVMLSVRLDAYNDKGYRDLAAGVTYEGYKKMKASPKVGVVYQLVKDKLSLFGNYQNGFNYTGAKNEQGKVFKPEQAYQYEGGIKADIWENRVSASLSYYDILVNDKLRANPNNPTFQVQDATQSSKGVEAEITASPLSNLNLMLGYGYNESEYTKADKDLEGKRPYSTPKHTFSSWLSYRIGQGAVKGFGIGAGANYVSESFFDDANTLILPSYFIVSSTLFYEHPSFRVGLKLDNLTNQQYWGPWGQPQALRSFGASFALKI